MRKFVYLCGMMLLCLNMMAQIDPYDDNWIPIITDDFDQPSRYFDNAFCDTEGIWIPFGPVLFPSGVTKGDGHSIFHREYCRFDGVNGCLYLLSRHIRDTPIECNEQPLYYEIPTPHFGRTYCCDTSHHSLYYYSAMIESPPVVIEKADMAKNENDWPELIGQFQYGYFEIRCKVPTHEGAKSAFWLWGAVTDDYYEEIDIYEFSWSFEDSTAIWHHNPHPHGAGNPYCFTSGMYINEDSASYEPMSITSKARNYLMSDRPLYQWHTFACEWLPDHVLWLCDGNVVNEYYNPDSIPSHPLTLKTSYQIDNYALQGNNPQNTPKWKGEGCLAIDYINVYQLKWDCNTEEVIAQQNDLNGFDFAVKKSISVTSSIEPIIISSTHKVTFRATDTFEITGPFQVDSGGEMTVIMQSCPE